MEAFHASGEILGTVETGRPIDEAVQERPGFTVISPLSGSTDPEAKLQAIRKLGTPVVGVDGYNPDGALVIYVPGENNPYAHLPYMDMRTYALVGMLPASSDRRNTPVVEYPAPPEPKAYPSRPIDNWLEY